MRIMKTCIALLMMTSLIMPVSAFAAPTDEWDDMLDSNKTINIYVEDIANDSGDANVSAGEVTQVVKDLFANRISPKFNVVGDKSSADVVFSGKITEYEWKKKAPLTYFFGAGAIVYDVATSSRKNFAMMRIRYKITDAKTKKTLVSQQTQVSIKRSKVPQEKSYDMIYAKAPKILTLDIFKRYTGKKQLM